MKKSLLIVILVGLFMNGCTWMMPYEEEFKCTKNSTGECGSGTYLYNKSIEEDDAAAAATKAEASTPAAPVSNKPMDSQEAVMLLYGKVSDLDKKVNHLKTQLAICRENNQEKAVAQDLLETKTTSYNGVEGVFENKPCQEDSEYCFIHTYYASVHSQDSLDSKETAVLAFRDVVKPLEFKGNWIRLADGWVKSWILKSFTPKKDLEVSR